MVIAYAGLGLLVVFGLVALPRFFVGGVYAGLLPYYWVEKIAVEQTPYDFKINLVYKDKKVKVLASDLGVRLSYAYGLEKFLDDFLSTSIWQRWQKYNRSLIENVNLTPAVSWEWDKVVNQVNNYFDAAWVKPRKVRLSYEKGRIRVIPGRDGYVLDEEKLKVRLKNLSLNDGVIDVPVRFVSYRVNETDLKEAIQRAQRVIETRIVLKDEVSSQEMEVSNQEKVGMVSVYGGVEEESINRVADRAGVVFDREPVNALFQYKNGRVVAFREAKEGFRVNKKKLKKELRQVIGQIMAGGGDRKQFVIRVEGERIKPEITTEKSNTYGIKELVGKGESWFVHSIPNRIHNVALAASKINGVLVAPGEVFSFNKYLGEVSARTGYRQSYVIKQGKTILDDGGGVCQVSTTLFRAVLNAGLPIVERKAHSYRVGYYEQKSPPGFDATVFAPYVDFKFKNDLDSYVLIQAKVDKKRQHLVFYLYGKKDGRKVKISKVRIWDQSPPPPPIYQDDPSLPKGTIKQIEWAAWGAKVAFDWVVEKEGKVLYKKTFYSNYRPWQAVYLRNL